MTIDPRRQRRSLLAALAAAPLVCATRPARAQAFPSKPLRIVVPYPPGGASDVTARLLGERLAVRMGQPVLVENRPGANGAIALEHVAKSPADGHTLLMANVGPNAINPGVYKRLPYDARKDFEPIIFTTVVPQVLVVNPALGVKTLKEFIAHVKANPGKLSYANGGNASSNHLAFEQLKMQAGLFIVAIPYRGDGPAMTDTIGGTVAATIPTVLAAHGQIKSGRLQALAVTTRERVTSLPDVPTMAEAGLPGFETFSWGGVMAPRGLPQDVSDRVYRELATVLAQPDVKQRLEGLGAIVSPKPPAEFARFIDQEIEKYALIAKRANIQPE